MGCDIHAMIERKAHWAGDSKAWYNSGDPDIGRNYEMFAVLAGVRNYDGIEPISEPRGMPSFKEWHEYSDGECWASWHSREEMPCREMEREFESLRHDGHSHSWLTLAEIKAYNTDAEVDDGHVITGRDEDGAVTSMARRVYSNGEDRTPTMEKVGRRKVLRWPGQTEPQSWLRLIRYMEQAKWDDQTDDEIRLVFFFDN